MQSIKWWALTCLVCSTLFVLSGINAPSASAEAFDADELEAFLDGTIYSKMDENNIPGITLSVVKDGEVLIFKGYGYADLKKREPVDPDRTLFRPGSASKLFTWTAVLQLAEQGKLDLDADVNNYLNFNIPDHLYNSSSKAEPITLTHLLTHTAGFEDVGEGLFVLSKEEMTSLESYLRQHLPARVFAPGEIMAYSNYGTSLAGYIVEKITDQPFADYIEDNIFGPLEMEHSTFRQPLPDDLAPDMAQPYRFSNGRYHQGDFEYISGSPAGALSSTASDMASFMIAHLDKGRYRDNRILEEETAREMHRQQFTQHPETTGMTYGFIEDVFNGKRVITHGGDTQLFNTGFYLLPEENLGLFISSMGGPFDRTSLFQGFMDRYYPQFNSSVPEPSPNARERAAEYRGEYRPNRSNFTSYEAFLGLLQSGNVAIDEEGHLLVNIYGEPVPMVEAEPGIYRHRYPDGTQRIKTLAFLEGPDGRTLMAPGGPMTYSKTPWYNSTLLGAGLLGGSFLLFAGTLLAWLISALRRRLRREIGPAPRVAILARAAAVACGLLIIAFAIGLITAITDVNPAYNVPNFFFGATPAVHIFLTLPLPIALLSLVMVIFTAISWWKGYWTKSARLHYTLLTAGGLGFMWVMTFNNLI